MSDWKVCMKSITRMSCVSGDMMTRCPDSTVAVSTRMELTLMVFEDEDETSPGQMVWIRVCHDDLLHGSQLTAQ